MTVVGPRSRIGAAAVLVGLSLISTPAAGVAAADDSDQSGSGPAAGSAAQQNTPTRGAARGSRSAAAPSPSLPPAAARSVSPRSAATSTPHRAATNPEPRAAAARSGPAPTTELPRTASAVASPAATTQSPPAESATSSSPAAPAPAATPATSTLVAPAKATTPLSPCAACWGFTAPSITQAVTTVVNHLFNNAFNALAGFPANPISNLVEGALVLIRRSLFGFVPTGVTANQDGNALGISVNSGSVAYFRNNNGTLEVAGDPGFSHAQTFTDSSVSQVLATGNGGCAGLAVTSGLIGAGLVTDGIDALRFGSAANVTGLTVAAGTTQLHISDAIRGMQGVVLAAPVVLDRDTEVDAGGGSAQFAGPVDGSGWFGGQSLTVTALGTTDFLGDVGADKPLGNLTTRGIAPLKITQSADTRTIPLYYMPESAGPGQFNIKYGIDVAFGDSPSRRYLFDTGGNGFFAFNNPGYLDGTTLGTDSVDITYSNGQTYEGVVASASKITIGTGKQSVSTANPVLVSAVNTVVTGGNSTPVTDPSIADSPLPGDFGAAFGVQQVGDEILYTPGSFIASVLFQLPGNLSSGYLVRLGPIGSAPSMTVGITPELKAQFTYALPVTQQAGSGVYPGTSNPLLEQFGLSGSYSATYDGDTEPISIDPMITIIDSGATSTFVRIPGTPTFPFDDDGNLRTGALLNAAFTSADPSKPDFTWHLTAGQNDSVNLVNYSTDTGAATSLPNVNTGLNLFNEYDVMYDVADQKVYLRPNGGQSTVSLQSVTTRGAQSYGQNAVLDGAYTTGRGAFSVSGVTTLAGDTVVNAGHGDVTFSGTVDGTDDDTQSLQVNSRGTSTFVRAVGGQVELNQLGTDAGGNTVIGTVSTGGAQTYADDVTLNGAYTSASGTFSIGGDTAVAGPTQVSAQSINFGGRVDSESGRAFVLQLSAPGTTSFAKKVGSKHPLGGLDVVGGTVTAARSVTLDGGLPDAQGAGLFIGQGTTVNFAEGGSIRNFSGPGVQFNDSSPNSILSKFTIADNGGAGVEVVKGSFTGTSITGNTIRSNGADGISLAAGAGPGVTTPAVTIANNTILDNAGNGVLVNGEGSRGNLISGNSISGNTALGIALTNAGNGNQKTPVLTSAVIAGPSKLVISGSVAGSDGYSGPFDIEVFASPGGDAANVQGRRYLESFQSTSNDFTDRTVDASVKPGEFITVTATPTATAMNTSQFSNAAQLT
jgi:hypothetical protein